MSTWRNWHLAHQYAQDEANRFKRPMGIEHLKEYGKDIYRVSWIPENPDKRFGWELRCEVVEPE